MSKVFVGMSGGVDSSLAAALLVEQGHEVTGVYMKNWTRDIAGWPCPWRADFLDAGRVAVQLGIDLVVFDFQNEYKQRVVNYMAAEYRAGRTPNPDIMCNQEIKFKLFLDTALERGADYIATGHYARIQLSPMQGPTLHSNPQKNSSKSSSSNKSARSDLASEGGRQTQLHRARDHGKDQTYFLYRVTERALQKTIFPIGEYSSKNETRREAKRRRLATAEKPDSQGICFVGEVGIRDFLQEFVEVTPGSILDQNDREIGQHEGAILYTLGQRHGLNVGGGIPYYVTRVDIETNTVHVTNELSSDELWSRSVDCAQAHWINHPPDENKSYTVRTRHLGELVKAHLVLGPNETFTAQFEKDMRALTPGQSLVVYDTDRVLGGGIIG